MAGDALKRGYPPEAEYDYAWPVDYPYDADPQYPEPLFPEDEPEPEDGGKRFNPNQLRDPHTGEWIDAPGGGEVAKARDALQALLPEGTKISRLDIDTGLGYSTNRLVLHRPGYDDPHEFDGGVVNYTPGEGQHIGRLTWRSDTGVIDIVFVAPEYRRQGIATAMLRLARAQAKEEGTARPKHSDNLEPEGEAWARAVNALGGTAVAEPESGLGLDVFTPEGEEVANKFRPFDDPGDEYGLNPSEMAASVSALNDLGKVLKIPEGQTAIPINDAGFEGNAEMEKEGSVARLELTGLRPSAIELTVGSPELRGSQPHDVLHEVGHALDYGVLRDRYGMDVAPLAWSEGPEIGLPELPVQRAIKDSPEIQRMHAYLDAQANASELRPARNDNTWDMLSSEGRRLGVQYTSDPKETFARAFAQWVALRSGDDESVTNLQDPDNWPVNGYAWSDENFAPIADEFDKFFAEQNMLRDPDQWVDL